MRVSPVVVVIGAVAFKLWLWWRTAPAEFHHVLCIVCLWLLVTVMAAIWMQRTEPVATQAPVEIFCNDMMSPGPTEWPIYCEHKLRRASRGIPPPEVTIAATPI